MTVYTEIKLYRLGSSFIHTAMLRMMDGLESDHFPAGRMWASHLMCLKLSLPHDKTHITCHEEVRGDRNKHLLYLVSGKLNLSLKILAELVTYICTKWPIVIKMHTTQTRDSLSSNSFQNCSVWKWKFATFFMWICTMSSHFTLWHLKEKATCSQQCKDSTTISASWQHHHFNFSCIFYFSYNSEHFYPSFLLNTKDLVYCKDQQWMTANNENMKASDGTFFSTPTIYLCTQHSIPTC